MVGASVLAIAIGGFAQYMATQYKTVRRINQKFAAIKVEQLLTRAMSDPLICGCLVQSFGTLTVGTNPGDETEVTELTPSNTGSCASVGTSVPIAKVDEPLNNDELLGVYTTRIFISDVTAPIGPPIPAAPGHPNVQRQRQGTINIAFGNKNGEPDTVVAPIRSATADFMFLEENGGTIAGCAGANFDRYFASEIQNHTASQDVIEGESTAAVATVVSEADAAIDTINDRVGQASTTMQSTATSTVANIEAERIRIVNLARTLLENLRPPPPVVPPGPDPDPDAPPYDCSSFNGSPAVLSSASHIAGDLIRVRAAGNVPAGASGVEFQINGQNRGSYPGGGASVQATLETYTSGATVEVRVVTSDENGCRSQLSNPISVTIP